jgi:hypothetical protein
MAFAAVSLLERLKERVRPARGSSGHRLFITALMLISKFEYDDTFSNRSWAIVAQDLFAVKEIGAMERDAGLSGLATRWYARRGCRLRSSVTSDPRRPSCEGKIETLFGQTVRAHSDDLGCISNTGAHTKLDTAPYPGFDTATASAAQTRAKVRKGVTKAQQLG